MESTLFCLLSLYSIPKIVLKMVINYLFSNKFLYPVLKKIRKKIQTITYLQSHSFEDNIQLKTMLNLLFSLFL